MRGGSDGRSKNNILYEEDLVKENTRKLEVDIIKNQFRGMIQQYNPRTIFYKKDLLRKY